MTNPVNWQGPSKIGPELAKRNCKPGKLPYIWLPGSNKSLPPKDMKK